MLEFPHQSVCPNHYVYHHLFFRMCIPGLSVYVLNGLFCFSWFDIV